MTVYIGVDDFCNQCDGRLVPQNSEDPGDPAGAGLSFQFNCRCKDCGRITSLYGQVQPATDHLPGPAAADQARQN